MKVIENRLHGFLTENQVQADASLFVERCWKSRHDGFKVSKKVYEQMANFVRSAAIQSKNSHEFFAKLLARYGAESPRPIFDRNGLIVPASWFKINLDEDGDVKDIIEKTTDGGKETTFILALGRYSDRPGYAALRQVLINETATLIILIREKAEYEKSMEPK